MKCYRPLTGIKTAEGVGTFEKSPLVIAARVINGVLRTSIGARVARGGSRHLILPANCAQCPAE